MGRPIPTGTVTLLFTDIEGSTRLWEDEPGPMAAALRRHDEVLRGSIERVGGYVFKTVGDAFCAAFGTAHQAVDAVLAAQRLLGAQVWPTSRPVRVRMGLHTGTCEERDGDYFGPVVNRAARLEAVAHGGQVLLSAATTELLAGALPEGVAVRDLGSHRLKDLGRPEQVYQLEAEFLATSFPFLKSLDNPELPNNLPSLLSAFVGRDRELAEVRELVSGSRLVTLTGAGGSGKTRLALQAAAELVGGVPDGVWLAELAPLTEGAQVPSAVAAALGLPDQGMRPSADSISRALRSHDALMLLDNCEHLIDAAATFCDQVSQRCPKIRFLVTSREPLGLDGERVYRVPSMSLPASDDDLSGSDAVRLFLARAQAQDSGFALDAQSAPLVATISRRLDGIPLALELAAARLSSMSLAQVTARLDQRFRLLTGGSRNALPRQQTLQATVDWSFGLLSAQEREVMTRLSAFAGGFELEAAEHVCAGGSVDGLDVMDLLGSLVGKSLVVAERGGVSMRYRLLETIRQYCAQELLRAVGEDEVLQVRTRHAEYYMQLAETAAPALIDRRQGKWFRRLDAEWDNIRAALAHLDAEQRGMDVIRLGVALERFALSRAHAEFLASMQHAVGPGTDDRASDNPGLLAAALLTTLMLMQFFDRSGPAAALTQGQHMVGRALAGARRIGDRALEARALGMSAAIAFLRGETETGQRNAAESVALARESGDVHLLGDMLSILALTGSPEDRRVARLEALDCYRRAGDDLDAANQLSQIYGLDLHAGCLDEAEAHLTEAVALAEPLGDEMFLLFFLSDLCVLRVIQDRLAEAAPLVRRSLLAVRRTGLDICAAEVIFASACCEAVGGNAAKAARLHGAADTAIAASLADRTMFWSDLERGAQEREQARLREQMGEAAFEDAYRAGARLSPSEAVGLALSRPAAAREG